MRPQCDIRAFTLVETLAAMLVAGILFLAVTEGLTLFFRLQLWQTQALLEAGRRREGYCRTERLIATADSVAADASGHSDAKTALWIRHGGKRAWLRLRDSALIYAEDEFRDTLLHGVEALGIVAGAGRADTVEIRLREGFTVRFAIVPSVQERHRQAVETIEKDYGYEE